MTRTLLIAIIAAVLVAPLTSTWVPPVEAAQDKTAPRPAPPAEPAPQAPAPPAPPEPPQPPPAPPAPESATNVLLDVVITDTVSGKPESKRVTLLLQDRQSGSVRTVGQVGVPHGVSSVELALDARVAMVGPNLIQVNLTFNYMAPPLAAEVRQGEIALSPARVTESLAVALRSGRQLLVSRSADPVTNRTVTVELTATIQEP